LGFKEEIFNAVRDFIMGAEAPEGFCDSIIVVIPKVTKPKHMMNFRGICLCNVICQLFKILKRATELEATVLVVSC
jgi:hypothetical protein